MQINFSYSMNKQQYYQWCKLAENLHPDMTIVFVYFKQLSVFCLLLLCCFIDRMFMLICGIVIFIIQADLIYHYMTPRRHWKTYKEFIEKGDSVLATENFLRHINPGRTEEYQWTVFSGFTVTQQGIYLKSKYFSLLYPRFCFPNESDWNAFVELASKSIRAQPSPDHNPDTKKQKSEDVISGNNP
jgi:hypothetical protein